MPSCLKGMLAAIMVVAQSSVIDRSPAFTFIICFPADDQERAFQHNALNILILVGSSKQRHLWEATCSSIMVGVRDTGRIRHVLLAYMLQPASLSWNTCRFTNAPWQYGSALRRMVPCQVRHYWTAESQVAWQRPTGIAASGGHDSRREFLLAIYNLRPLRAESFTNREVSQSYREDSQKPCN